jgi:hypothetical protein
MELEFKGVNQIKQQIVSFLSKIKEILVILQIIFPQDLFYFTKAHLNYFRR